MARLGSMFMLTVVSLGATGCGTLAQPDWFHPGTAREQQMRAQRYDPYAENESGPPIVGGRPRGYQKPLAEPLRARWGLTNGGDPRW